MQPKLNARGVYTALESSIDERLWLQLLLLVKVVCQTAVHENLQGAGLVLLSQQNTSVVLFSLVDAACQVPLDHLFARVAVGWVANRRKCRRRAECALFAQIEDQGTVATHGVTEDRSARNVDRDLILGNDVGNFFQNVIIHVVVLAPRLTRRIHLLLGSCLE